MSELKPFEDLVNKWEREAERRSRFSDEENSVSSLVLYSCADDLRNTIPEATRPAPDVDALARGYARRGYLSDSSAVKREIQERYELLKQFAVELGV